MMKYQPSSNISNIIKLYLHIILHLQIEKNDNSSIVSSTRSLLSFTFLYAWRMTPSVYITWASLPSGFNWIHTRR
jgi:hypothetical protein